VVIVLVVFLVLLFFFGLGVFVFSHEFFVSSADWSFQIEETLLAVVLKMVEVQFQLLVHLFPHLFHVVVRLLGCGLRVLTGAEFLAFRGLFGQMGHDCFSGLCEVEVGKVDGLFGFWLGFG
jgi:hypothetical protein